MSRLLFATVLSLAATLSGALSAHTAVAQDAAAAQTFLRGRHDAVKQIMQRTARTPAAIAQRKTQLTAALGELLDYTELAHRSLGPDESRATPAQRAEFTTLLRQLVERSYQKNLESTVDYAIRYVGAAGQPTNVTVRTMAKSRTNGREPEISIDYSIHQVGGAWRVFDVATDGVSLVRSYRESFHRIIARDGFDALLVKLRERIANEGEL